MILFVELCVDLRKGKSAKDGLYQYKNIAQNSNVGTIEVGFFFLLATFSGLLEHIWSTNTNIGEGNDVIDKCQQKGFWTLRLTCVCLVEYRWF